MSGTQTGSSRFLGNTVMLVVATVLGTALTLAQMKLLAAHLSFAVFGLFASLRGLSLLVSMLAANGFPQVLVRFLPEYAARGARSAAVRLGVVAIGATSLASVAMLLVVFAFKSAFFRGVEVSAIDTPLLVWFSVTTLAVALKLVLYGGFNGLRRFGSQTVLETAALAVQVVWIAVERDALTLPRLFEITGVTSLVTALVAIPWYASRLSRDVGAGAPTPSPRWGRYWGGAVGLSVVALAFSDVDRWVLSNVLALEPLSMFHVASRVVRLANRFIAIPVLAFQPEVTRVAAEGRSDAVELATRAFFKATLLLAVFAAGAMGVFASALILLAANDAYLAARTTMWLLAASIPLSAMTAPLTAVMKSLDAVRSALYCDLAWAGVYVVLLLTLASPLGVEGPGVAQLAASTFQLIIAVRLAVVRPSVAEMSGALAKSTACAVIAFAPAVLLECVHAPLVTTVAAGVAALWIYLRLARRARVLSEGERERVRTLVRGRGLGPALAWFIP